MSPSQLERARRRQKRRRRRRMIASVTLAVLAVLTLFVLSVTVWFPIERVEVSGSTRYDAQQVVASTGIHTGDNLLRLDTAGVAARVQRACPYVATAKVERALPNVVRIHLTQAKPVAAAPWNGKQVLFDRSGKVLELAAKAPQGVPTATGLDIRGATPGGQLAFAGQEKSKLFTEMATALEQSGLQHVSAMDVSDQYQLKAVYQGRITLELGNRNYLKKKFSFAKSVLAQRVTDPKEQGRLDLSTISDKRALVTYMPAQSAASQKPASSKAP